MLCEYLARHFWSETGIIRNQDDDELIFQNPQTDGSPWWCLYMISITIFNLICIINDLPHYLASLLASALINIHTDTHVQVFLYVCLLRLIIITFNIYYPYIPEKSYMKFSMYSLPWISISYIYFYCFSSTPANKSLASFQKNNCKYCYHTHHLDEHIRYRYSVWKLRYIS